MFNRFTKRDGPLFREHVVVDGKNGKLVGGLDTVIIEFEDGSQMNGGKVELVPSQDAGRATRTWVACFENRKVIFGEEGLSAGGPERKRG